MNKSQAIPSAGDAVILTGEYSFSTPGTIGVIGGSFGDSKNLSVTFNARSYRCERYVSCGGGPATFDLPELFPTGRTLKVPFWRFKDGVAMAHNDETFVMEVPLWEFRGERESPFWGRESIEKLLADRASVRSYNPALEAFPAEWTEGRILRGDHPLTDIPNRPVKDLTGEKIVSKARQRRLLTVICHEVPVGCNYLYTVEADGPFKAFRTLQELDAWKAAYNLQTVSVEPRTRIVIEQLKPTADVSTWLPLRCA